MVARFQTARQQEDKGFTLVELLVVIVIIGILAAIAIPLFLNQREKGWKAQVESDLKNAAIAAETYAVDNNGSYEGLGTDELEDNGFKGTDQVDVEVAEGADEKGFVLTGKHDSLDEILTYDSNDGGLQDWAESGGSGDDG